MQVEDLVSPTFFVYDLEFIGDVKRPETCLIWDLAVLCVRTGETFRAVIDPDPMMRYFPPPPAEGCMQLTRAFLNRHRAKPVYNILPKLFRWMMNRTKHVSVMISHNNFRSDKPVIEFECMRYGIAMPTNLYFFDSLLYFRDTFPKLGDYSMQHLVKRFLPDRKGVSHRAYQDTMDLHAILNYDNLKGEVLRPFSTSLRAVQGIGRAVQNRFFTAGLFTLDMVRDQMQQLNIYAVHHGMDQHSVIRNWLRTILGDLPLGCHINVHRSITA